MADYYLRARFPWFWSTIVKRSDESLLLVRILCSTSAILIRMYVGIVISSLMIKAVDTPRPKEKQVRLSFDNNRGKSTIINIS